MSERYGGTATRTPNTSIDTNEYNRLVSILETQVNALRKSTDIESVKLNKLESLVKALSSQAGPGNASNFRDLARELSKSLANAVSIAIKTGKASTIVYAAQANATGQRLQSQLVNEPYSVAGTRSTSTSIGQNITSLTNAVDGASKDLLGSFANIVADGKDLYNYMGELTDEIISIQDMFREIAINAPSLNQIANSESTSPTAPDGGNKGGFRGALGGLIGGIGGIISNAMSSLGGPLGIIVSLIKKIIDSSPLLSAIMDLLNLVVTLFFLPIGQKIGEILLPAVLWLVDLMVAWNEFMDDPIGGLMFLIEQLVDFLTPLFTKIWTIISEVLPEVLASILNTIFPGLGDLFKKFYDFMTSGLLITILSKIEEFLPSIAELLAKAIQVIKDIQNFLSGAIGNIIKDPIGSITDSAGNIFDKIGAAIPWFADGGYVSSSVGGTIIGVGEGGEGEYIIPESKMGAVGGTTINISIGGSIYADDLVQRIADVVDSKNQSASYR